MLQTSRDICRKKPLSFLRYSFIRYSRHEGLCFSWLVAGWTGDACISDQSDWSYYEQPNYQSNCRLQSYLLTSSKMVEKAVFFRVVSSRIMIITRIETTMQHIFFEKNVLKMYIYRWYKQKSLKAAKRHLEVERASVFFTAKWTFNSINLL